MKTGGFVTVLAITVLTLASSGIAQEVCRAETLKGTYVVTCNGFARDLQTNSVLVPFAAQGIFHNEVNANGEILSSGTFNESVGGRQLSTFFSSSSVTILSDCTGNITFDVFTARPPEGQFTGLREHLIVAILDQGKELRTFNKGPLVSTCSARLMSRNTNQQDQTQ